MYKNQFAEPMRSSRELSDAANLTDELRALAGIEFKGRGLLLYDCEKQISVLSPELIRLTGFESEFQGHPADLFHKGHRAIVRRMVEEPAQPDKRVELKLKNTRGQIRTVYLQKQQVHNKVALGITDITKEQNIIDRFELALETSKIGFWDWNIESNTFYVSDSFYTILNIENLRASSKSAIQLLPMSEKRKVLAVKQKYLSGLVTEYFNEYWVRLRNSQSRWFYSKSKLIDIEDADTPKRVISVIIDINEEVKYRESLKLHNEQIKNQAFSLAHEVRLPASNIMGLIDLLLTGEEKDREELMQALQSASTELDQSIRCLIKQMEDFNN